MSEILTAIFQNGAFVPDQATAFTPGERVRLIVAPLESASDAASLGEFDALCDEIAVNADQSRMTRDQLHERG